MPLGLDLKSVIVGVLFAYFVLPFIMGLINKPKAQKAAA
jgi:hypothetical protein